MDKDIYVRVKEAAENLVGGLSMEAVDVKMTRQGGRIFLSVYIDKDGGVTLEDCTTANNLLGEIIERDQLIKGPYIIEVMSPGLDRPLKGKKDFIKAIDKYLRIKLHIPVNEQFVVRGRLRNFVDGKLIFDDIEGREMILDIDNISEAKIEVTV